MRRLAREATGQSRHYREPDCYFQCAAKQGKNDEEDEDLIDKAVTRTILNAGEVHFLPKDQMPGGSEIAAVMRY